jgi:hypothetical protein
MKKFIVAILAFVYITTSMGATIHMHYCMGKMANWSLDFNRSKTCGKCGMEKGDKKDNGCCKDENKFIKNDNDQKAAETGFQAIQLIAVALPVSFVEIPSINFPGVSDKNTFIHSPPRSSAIRVYIINRTILI